MTVSHKKQQRESRVKSAPGIGSRIRALRETEVAISLRELARRSGVSVGHLSRIERDLQEPTIGMLRAIAAGLGISFIDVVVDPESDLRSRLIAETRDLEDEELRELLEMAEMFGRRAPRPDTVMTPPKTARKRTSGTRPKKRRRPKRGE